MSTSIETDSAAVNLRTTQPLDWEITAIGNFLLNLYHTQVISPRQDWLVLKKQMRQEFHNFLNAPGNFELPEKFREINRSNNIGTFLQRTNFLLNTERGSDYYKIRSLTFFQYRNKKLEEYDDKHKNGDSVELLKKCSSIDGFLKATNNDDTNDQAIDPAFASNCEVDENAKLHLLAYQGTEYQERNTHFAYTNMSCYICQQDFNSASDFEEHVADHGEELDFKTVKNLKKLSSSLLNLSYKLCKNSHYFCFTIESTLDDVTIERIIIVQSRSMYHVPKSRIPYALPANRKDNFFVDSHLFSISLEQPIVIVFHTKSQKNWRIVEQHHFWRIEAFPMVNFAINSCRLSDKKLFKPKFKLPQYQPTAEIRDALKDNLVQTKLMKTSNEFNNYVNNANTFTRHNIVQVLNTLLQIEDIDRNDEYSCLKQTNVKLRQFEREYSLQLHTERRLFIENVLSQYDEVLIIPENQAHTIANDLMDLHLKNTDDIVNTKTKKQKYYFGEVERVLNRRVTFKTQQTLPKDKTFTLIFRPARLTMRYQYRALELLAQMSANDIERFLFPTDVNQLELTLTPSLVLTNRQVYDNREQLQAVKYITYGPHKDAPYIIFGPPGTGKTTTVVESILQLYLRSHDAKILVTAGSNSACDEIALRICKTLAPLIDPFAITRIYSRANEKRLENIDEILLESSNMYSVHFYPDVAELHQYRIVVCTLSVVGKLATGKFGRDDNGAGIFSHIFVDEVAASTEAETLVGIMGTLSPKARLILSGDHKQLGAILHSARAIEMGLNVSLMERLLTRDCYNVDAEGNYNRSIQTRLLQNHRSHPAIVSLYSRLFYNNELRASANPDVLSLCRKWHRAPNPQYPVIFHSVFGTVARDNNSVSLYNQRELEVVMDYVKDLMYFGVDGEKISQTDIGIISPYKRQYLRIQEELNLRNWYQIETGSVELFQGKEKKIIIVSFVRSFTATLGFLDNPKRLNVTLSRAKSLLILIGNPKTLSLNDDFKQIIEICHRNKTLVGANYYELNDNGATDSNNTPPNKLKNGVETTNSNLNSNHKNQNANKKQNQKKREYKYQNNKMKANNGKTNAGLEQTQQQEVKLSQKMKKQVQTNNLTQGQKKNLIIYKNLLQQTDSNEALEAIEIKEEKTEMDKLFDELPKVPQRNGTKVQQPKAAPPRSCNNINNIVQQQPTPPQPGVPSLAANNMQAPLKAQMETPIRPAGVRFVSKYNYSPAETPPIYVSRMTPRDGTGQTFMRSTPTVNFTAARADVLTGFNYVHLTPTANIIAYLTAPVRTGFPSGSNRTNTTAGTSTTFQQTRPVRTFFPEQKQKSTKSKCVIA